MNVRLAFNTMTPKCAEGPCARADLKAMLTIFAGLCAFAIVICGAIDSVRSPVILEDPKILNAENVIGPIDMDLIASCGKNPRRLGADQERCHDSGVVRASFHN